MTTVTEQSPPSPPPSSSAALSRSTTKTTNASHEFLIEGYSLAKGIGIGNHIASTEFTVGGYQWAIYFYPDGKNMEDKSEFVSAFIALTSEGTNVRALFELKLVDQSGQGKHKVHSHFVRPLETGPYTLKKKGSMWGYRRFFRRALLESSDFLKNDCLKFNCTVGVVVSATDCPQLNSIHVPEANIGSHVGAPLENMEGSDVTIDVASDTTEPTIDTSDWRTQLQPDQRQRIVNKIMDTLRKHLPVSDSEALLQLQNIAQRFEDKIYTDATSQSDYLRKISMKMLTMENKSKNTMANNMSSNEGGSSNNPPDQGQQYTNPLPSQHQPRQQLLSQTIQNNVAPQPNFPSVSTLPQISSQNISQNFNTQQPGQNYVSNAIGQNSNVQSMFPGSQRQMPGWQQVVPQQQQSQNPQQILYQQQLLHRLPQIQQNFLQPNQLQSSQQSVMQTSSAMQSSTMQSSLSILPQNQQQILYQQQLLNYKQSQMLQQQQQLNLLQSNQLLSSQQSVMQTSLAMQPSMMQSSLSSLPQNPKLPQMLQQQQQQNSLQPNQLQSSLSSLPQNLQQILYQQQLLKHKLSQILQQQQQQQLMMIMMMMVTMMMMMVVMMKMMI